MSTVNHQAIAQRLTRDRLRSLHEDIGRLEVVFRNAIDEALVAFGTARAGRRSGTGTSSCFPAASTEHVRSPTSTLPAVALLARACSRRTAR